MSEDAVQPEELPGLRLLSGERLAKRLRLPPREGGLVITPLLDRGQVARTTIDLRLGAEFLVSLRTRNPAIDTSKTTPAAEMNSFFERTFRDFGEAFVLYPLHFVLGSTFEYVRMPDDLCAELHVRSSLGRSGVSIRGFVQPGYMGVLTLELANHSGNTLVLYPGMRAVQLAFFEVDAPAGAEYVKAEAAKYLGGIGPQLSQIQHERDWTVLERMRLARSKAEPPGRASEIADGADPEA